MIFVYAVTIIITALFLMELIWLQKIRGNFKNFILNRRKRPFFLAVILYFLIIFLTLIFSSHPYTSFWGYYTRFHGGLASLICYVLLFFILGFQLHNNSINLKKLFYALFISAFLVALYGALQHFGIDKHYWVQDSQARVFSFFGQPNWLSSWLIMIFPPLFIFWRKAKGYAKYLLGGLMILIFLTFYFTYSFSGILGIFSALFCLFFFVSQRNWKKISLYFLPFIFFFCIVLIFIPGVLSMKFEEVYYDLFSSGSRTTKIRLLVWKGTLDYIFSSPKVFLIGSGPETFAYSFLPFRLQEMNYTQEWDFLFNKAHNEFLNFWATTGTLGLVTYLYLIVIFLMRMLKASKPLHISFGAAIIGFLVTNFFGFSVVGTALLFWLYLGISVSDTVQK